MIMTREFILARLRWRFPDALVVEDLAPRFEDPTLDPTKLCVVRVYMIDYPDGVVGVFDAMTSDPEMLVPGLQVDAWIDQVQRGDVLLCRGS